MTENAKQSRCWGDRRTFLAAAGGLGSIGLAGCLGDSPDEENDNGTDNGLTEIRLAITHPGLWDTAIITYEILKQQGFLEEEGLEASVVDVTAEGGIRALLADDADISLSSGIMGAYAAYREGSPINIVANEWSGGSDLVWYSASDSEYQSLEDATDARIGYSDPGASTHMVALTAVSHADLSDAELISVGGPPDARSAVETDEVDLGWTVPPFFFNEIQGEELQHVFRGDDIPPFHDMTLRIHTAATDWLEENGDIARSYFNAYQRGLEWAYNNVSEAAQIWGEVIEFEEYGILEQALEENYPKEHLELDRIRNVDASIELAIEHEFIESPLSDEELDELIDLSYVE